MSVHVTKYETKDGKTRKAKSQKPKDGSPDPKSGDGTKTSAGNPAKKGE